MIAQEGLPGSLIDKCMEVLKAVVTNERDFIQVVVEAIIDLRDDAEVESTVCPLRFRLDLLSFDFILDC
jgi:hypothetical protein